MTSTSTPGTWGSSGGQQAALEGLADRHALGVQAGVVEGEGGPAGEVLGEFQDLLAEVVVGGLAEGQHADDAVAGDKRQDDRLAADRGGRGEGGADAGGEPAGLSPGRGSRREVRRAARWAASAGRGPHAGAGGRHRVGRVDLGEEGLEAVDPLLVLVEDVGEVRLGGLVGDRVDGAPGGERRDRHLGHQGQGLVAVEGAGEQVGGLDEEGEGAAAQSFQLAEAGRFDGQGDAVGGELEAQGLLVGVAARGFGGDAEGAGEAALDLERDGDDRAHAGAAEERDGAGDGGEVLVDGGHTGGAVASGAGFDGDAGEPLAGGGQAGGGADLQLGLVVGGEQQEGGVAVEHVAGAFDGALEEAVEVVGGGGADEDLEGVRGAALGAGVGRTGARCGVCRMARSSSRTRRQTVEGSPSVSRTRRCEA